MICRIMNAGINMNNTWCVYKHTSPSAKVYIGVTKKNVDERWSGNGNRYRGSASFHNAIKKYGWDNFILNMKYYIQT